MSYFVSYILKKQYLFEQNIAFLRKIKNSKKSHSRVHFAWLWDFLSGGGEGSRTPDHINKTAVITVVLFILCHILCHTFQKFL